MGAYLRGGAQGLRPAPVIVVHSLAHAVAALNAAAAADRDIVLLSAPEAGIYAGAGWFRALLAAASEAVPQARFAAWLDCGDDAGAALAALRAKVPGVIFSGRDDVARRLADIARQQHAEIATARPPATLDLADALAAAADALTARCADAIASMPPIC